MAENDTLEQVKEAPSDPGDHEKFAHYVNKLLMGDAYVLGTELVALCGKRWVPSRDPKKFPVCPTCKEIYNRLPEEWS